MDWIDESFAAEPSKDGGPPKGNQGRGPVEEGQSPVPVADDQPSAPEPQDDGRAARADGAEPLQRSPAESANPEPAPKDRFAWFKDAFAIEPFWYGLVSLALGFRGQSILTPGQESAFNPDFEAAKRWYIAAIAVMLFGWWETFTNHSLLARARDAGWNIRRRLALRDNRIRLGIIAAAILLNLLAIYILYGDWYSFIGGWLWALSLLVLVIACIAEEPGVTEVDEEPGQASAPRVDPADGRAAAPRGYPADGPRRDDAEAVTPHPEGTRRTAYWHIPRYAEFAAVAACVVLGFIMRVWRLGDLTPGMHGDEGEAGWIGLEILHGIPISPFLRGWFNQSDVYFWCVAIFMKIFGTGLIGLRSWAVFCGLVTIVFVYLLTREMFGVRAAIIAGFFIAFQSADILQSRQLSINAATTALTPIAFYFLVRGLKRKKHLDFVLCGFAAGFNIYFYAGGRLIGPMIAIIMAYLAVFHRTFLRDYWTRVLAFGISALAITTPFFALSYAYPLPPNGYPNDRWIWLHQADLTAIYGTSDWRTIVWDQLQRTLSIFTWSGDNSANHILDYPIARPLEAVLLVLGVVWALWRWRDTRFTLLSIWFWVTVIVGGTLTVDAPNVPRLTELLPAMPIFMAAWLDHLGGQVQVAIHKALSGLPVSRDGSPHTRPRPEGTRKPVPGGWPSRAAPWATGVALGAVVLVSGVQNWDKYINYYLNTHTQPDVTEQAIYVQHQGMGYRYYDLGAPDIYFTHGDNRFINYGADGIDAVNLSDTLPITDNGPNGEKDVDFMVWGAQYHYLSVVKAYYPGGTEATHPYGDTSAALPPLISYVVTHQQIDRYRTLLARYIPASGSPIVRREGSIGTDTARPPASLRYPSRVSWSGGLVAPIYGEYRFQLSAPPGSRLAIDGTSLILSGGASRIVAMDLAQGVHTISLTAGLATPNTRVSLQWSTPNSDMEPIGRQYLWDDHIGRSWSGEIVPTAGGSGVIETRIDGFLGFRAINVPIVPPMPFHARWLSDLHVRKPGLYTFEVQAAGAATFMVDGKSIIDDPGDGNLNVRDGTVQLGPGIHRLEVDYDWQIGIGELEIWWTPPGGTKQYLISPLLTPPPSTHPTSR